MQNSQSDLQLSQHVELQHEIDYHVEKTREIYEKRMEEILSQFEQKDI